MRAIQLTSFEGPSALRLTDVPAPRAAHGEHVLDVLTAGVNYADTHIAENSYLLPQVLPLIPGMEVVVADYAGRRHVGYIGSNGYAEQVTADPATLLRVPDGVSDAAALSTVVQGSSAWHLLRTCARLRPGETVVVHAGGGGVGQLAIQLAARWGAGRVIATASTAEKRALCEDLGADATVDSRSGDLTADLVAANGGVPVDIVLEMTGGSVFAQSLDAVAPLGRLVHYGIAGQVVAARVDPTALMATSRAVIGFWLQHVIDRPGGLRESMTGLLELYARGELISPTVTSFPLARAADAHRSLRGRGSVGKHVLTVHTSEAPGKGTR